MKSPFSALICAGLGLSSGSSPMGSFFRVPASSASSASAAFLSGHRPAGGRITERFIAPMVEPGGVHRSVARVGPKCPRTGATSG